MSCLRCRHMALHTRSMTQCYVFSLILPGYALPNCSTPCSSSLHTPLAFSMLRLYCTHQKNLRNLVRGVGRPSHSLPNPKSEGLFSVQCIYSMHGPFSLTIYGTQPLFDIYVYKIHIYRNINIYIVQCSGQGVICIFKYFLPFSIFFLLFVFSFMQRPLLSLPDSGGGSTDLSTELVNKNKMGKKSEEKIILFFFLF